MDYNRFLSAEAKRFTTASLAGLVHRFAGLDGVISLAAGLPPAESFPVTGLAVSTAKGQAITLGQEGRQVYLAQQYNFNPQGYDLLLDWLRNLTVQLHGIPVANTPSTAAAAVQPHPQSQPAPTSDERQCEAAPAEDGGGCGSPEVAIAAAPAGPGSAEPHPGPSSTAASRVVVAAPQGPVRDLVLTCGAIHAIFAIISCFTDPGDTLVVDEYTYTHALECVFLPRGLRLLPVRGDELGLDPDDLDRKLTAAAAAAGGGGSAGWRRPRLLYTVPTGHNPTGAVMSEQRKRRILEVCEAHDLLILEDDAYYWLYYPQPEPQPSSGREPQAEVDAGARADGSGAQPQPQLPGLWGLPPSLVRLDRSGRVLRVDTFSKLLGPGYRLGWITAPQPLVGKLANWVQASTVGPSSLSQVLVCRMLQQWGLEGFEEYVRELQALYAARAGAAHAAASAHLAGLATWQRPAAGMFMWLTLAGGLDAGCIVDELVAAKVVVVPGAMFATTGLQATWEPGTGAEEPQQQQRQRQAEGHECRQQQGGGVTDMGPPASPCMRLSFAGCAPEVFAEGIARLAAVVRAARDRRNGDGEAAAELRV